MQINDLSPLPLLRLYSYKSSFFRVDFKKKRNLEDSVEISALRAIRTKHRFNFCRFFNRWDERRRRRVCEK